MVRVSLLILGFQLSQLLGFGLPKSYEVILISVSSQSVDNRHVIDLSNLRITGRERAVNGTIIITEDLDDTYEGYGNTFIDSAGNGEFKQLPMIIQPTGICKGIKENNKYFYPSLKQGINTDLPLDGSECPVRKGTYYIKDMLVDPSSFPDFLPRGFLKGVIHLMKGDQNVGIVEVVSQIKDKIF